MTTQMAGRLKWVVLAVLAAAAGVVCFAVVRHLANFTGWAARFLERGSRLWAWLFDRRAEGPGEELSPVARGRLQPPRPFGSFRNPFDPPQPWTAYKLACYTFAAFEALARERGIARRTSETPLEHAERVAAELPGLKRDSRRLAIIYARGLYTSGDLPADVNDVLRVVWERMETSPDQPLAVKMADPEHIFIPSKSAPDDRIKKELLREIGIEDCPIYRGQPAS
jgi:hypothetical protein